MAAPDLTTCGRVRRAAQRPDVEHGREREQRDELGARDGARPRAERAAAAQGGEAGRVDGHAGDRRPGA
jgi:hypothetical protein